MLKLETLERTENGKALSVIGNGNGRAQSLGLVETVYQSAGERVKTVLALELVRIENAIAESQNWLHEGLCDCEQCLYELSKQRKLCQARQRILEELSALEDDADEEIECVRCCQPFRPTMGDETICDECYLHEHGPPHR
mgnify:CR=1 FL=1